MKPWTYEEEKKLEELYLSTSVATLVRTFDRSEQSIAMRAYHLGLTGKKLKPWTLKDDKELKELYESQLHVNEIAERLRRTSAAVSLRAMSLGLHRLTPVAHRGNELAKEYFKRQGLVVVSEGLGTSAADLVVHIKGIDVAVNVKTGRHCVITLRNLERLVKLKMPVMFLYVTPTDKVYILKLVQQGV